MLNAKIGKVGKVLVCGMKNVGKTALIEQLVYGNINADTVSWPKLFCICSYLPIQTKNLITLRNYTQQLRIYM